MLELFLLEFKFLYSIGYYPFKIMFVWDRTGAENSAETKYYIKLENFTVAIGDVIKFTMTVTFDVI